MKNLAVSLCLLSLVGCATSLSLESSVTEVKPELLESKVEQRELMIGKWYGDQPTKQGGRKQWLVNRINDGTYTITFLVTKPNNSKQTYTETGYWGVAGNIYFSIYRGAEHGGQFYPTDPSDPYNYDAYNIVNLTSESFEYENLDSKNKYVLNKVSSSFVLDEDS